MTESENHVRQTPSVIKYIVFAHISPQIYGANPDLEMLKLQSDTSFFHYFFLSLINMKVHELIIHTWITM